MYLASYHSLDPAFPFCTASLRQAASIRSPNANTAQCKHSLSLLWWEFWNSKTSCEIEAGTSQDCCVQDFYSGLSKSIFSCGWGFALHNTLIRFCKSIMTCWNLGVQQLAFRSVWQQPLGRKECFLDQQTEGNQRANEKIPLASPIHLYQIFWYCGALVPCKSRDLSVVADIRRNLLSNVPGACFCFLHRVKIT